MYLTDNNPRPPLIQNTLDDLVRSNSDRLDTFSTRIAPLYFASFKVIESRMKEVILLMAGSFNPVTMMHLRMMEIARDHLRAHGIIVRRGFVSPVHDAYGKEGLLSIAHRSAMLNLALESSDWVELSLWESEQTTWTPTLEVLQHHIMSLDQGSNLLSNRENAKKKKLSTASTSSDVNGNPSQPIQIMFLCGGDVLAGFAVPNVWRSDHIEKILLEHGIVVITRSGHDIDRIIYENDLLYQHRKHIMVVREFIENTISSTKIRKACSRGLSIKYLVPDKVETYILKNKLYCPSSKHERVQHEFGRIRLSPHIKLVRAKNSKKITTISESNSVEKFDLKNESKVGRPTRRSKNIVKRSQR